MDGRVGWAVGRWARRVGHTAVFDQDDARQEAAIGVWRAGPAASATVAYRRILDAVRALTPGWRGRSAPEHVSLDDAPDVAEHITPEHIAAARETLRRLAFLPDEQRLIADLCMQGLSGAEIARRIGKSEMWVSRQLAAVHAFIARQHAPRPRFTLRRSDDLSDIVRT